MARDARGKDGAVLDQVREGVAGGDGMTACKYCGLEIEWHTPEELAECEAEDY